MVVRLVVLVALVAAAIFGAQLYASESGEVVVLRTFTDEGAHETRLWIVEDENGTSWLRAGQAGADWYQRIKEEPRVEVVRDGEVYRYRAFPIESGPPVERVHTLMFDKYGWADEYIGMLVDRSSAVAIRLDPL